METRSAIAFFKTARAVLVAAMTIFVLLSVRADFSLETQTTRIRLTLLLIPA